MEIQRNKDVKIPVGFRFYPTDEELIIHYLKRKVYSLQLPATVIPELDVFQTNPSDLPGDSSEKRYFFSKRTMNLNKCSSGYWKSIGKYKKIVAPGNNQTIGVKKSLIFYKGNCTKTSWVMHQYSLVTSFSTQKITMPEGEWVVCCVFRKKVKRPAMTLAKNISKIASPSCSSGITEIS
ncbi:NAC domain-containing protein 83-like [Olea europaea var. sylvestris]|uniref:NAC domain-containing 83-like n=1 Tax=Olea europaea subsp. europaea TaxID=158383 RepID=A0A8S0TFP2_OLEEU|nr:NAC domain-containing protein 83-like [Olea europaea var. sylvestris]CAA3003042.1 NAC domain-containing 83-like [Olea europaea subsp. europaea]